MSDKKKTLRIPMSERLYGRSDCRIIAERFGLTVIYGSIEPWIIQAFWKIINMYLIRTGFMDAAR